MRIMKCKKCRSELKINAKQTEIICNVCGLRQAVTGISYDQDEEEKTISEYMTCVHMEEQRKTAKRRKCVRIVATVSTTLLGVLLAGILVVTKVMIPAKQYKNALAFLNGELYGKAYEMFKELGDYKDAASKAKVARKKMNQLALKNCEVGDYVILGTYEQDRKPSNGAEEIEWLVLEIKDGKALLISKYVLDSRYLDSEESRTMTWETCHLRHWLNETFFNTAFSAEEREMIQTVTVSADENPLYDVPQGNATQDKIFLLSVKEVYKYFETEEARKCKRTISAPISTDKEGNCDWWLRTLGEEQDAGAVLAVKVAPTGSVNLYGWESDKNRGVRPVMWVDLNF